MTLLFSEIVKALWAFLAIPALLAGPLHNRYRVALLIPRKQQRAMIDKYPLNESSSPDIRGFILSCCPDPVFLKFFFESQSLLQHNSASFSALHSPVLGP